MKRNEMNSYYLLYHHVTYPLDILNHIQYRKQLQNFHVLLQANYLKVLLSFPIHLYSVNRHVIEFLSSLITLKSNVYTLVYISLVIKSIK